MISASYYDVARCALACALVRALRRCMRKEVTDYTTVRIISRPQRAGLYTTTAAAAAAGARIAHV